MLFTIAPGKAVRMTVLSRKLGDAIPIAAGIVVKVLDVRGINVTLGITGEAPAAMERSGNETVEQPGPLAAGPERDSSMWLP
jgi:hypothetical protein